MKDNVEFNFSMQNLPDTTTMWVLGAPVEFYTHVAKSAGYDGLEYYPYRIPHAQVRGGIVTPNAMRTIGSAHQSFRTEKNVGEAWNHRNRGLAIKAMITMPEKVNSLIDLKMIQDKKGRDFNVVVYPPDEWRRETQPEILARLRNKIIQPSPELLSEWGVNSARDFASEASKRGFGICLDLFHIR